MSRLIRFLFITQRPLRRLIIGLVIGIVVGGLMTLALHYDLLHRFRRQLQDGLYQPKPTSGIISIVAIDDASLGAYGRSTTEWDRAVYTRLVTRLNTAGARVIVFDVLFAEPTDSDAALAEAMQAQRGVIEPISGLAGTDAYIGEDNRFVYPEFERPTPELEGAARLVGHIMMGTDQDGTARRVPLFISDGGETPVPSLAMAAMLAYLRYPINAVEFGDDSIQLAGRDLVTDDHTQMMIYFFGPPSHTGRTNNTFDVYSLVDVVDHMTDDELAARFADRIVLVGALDAVGIHDNYPTPGSGDEKMYGVEVHANSIETIYNALPERQDAIGQTLPLHLQSRSTQMILIFLMGLGAGIVLPFMRWYVGLLAVLGFYALYWLVASYAFVERGEIYELLFPAGSLAFTYTAAAVISYVFEERRRGQIHDLFSRYVSPEIAQKIVESYDQGKLQLGGEEREITVLFADIRGFTPLSEGLAPAEVVALLNVFLEEMSTIVMKNGGAINKYIGDNIMAFWNAPYPQPDHAWMAVQAGLGMLEAVRRLNASGRFVTPVQFGIGINTGPVVVGNVGSRQRLEYTPIGDTVNTASRLCGVAPGGACFVGKGTYEIVKDRITPVQVHRMMLKGKHEPVEIYELRPDPEKKA